MSEDPMMMGGLSAESIAEAVEIKKMSKKAKDPIAQKNAETAAKREERLQSRGGDRELPPAPAAATAPVKPPVDKSSLLDKIEAYRERFPQLKARNKLTGKSTTEEVQDELHYIEQQLGQREGHMGSHVFLLVMTGLEESTNYYNPLDLQLQGLSRVAQDNKDQFAPILDELFIKYGASMYMSPEMRLVMATATLVYTVHSANSGNAAVAEAMQKMNKKVSMPETDL